MRHTRKLLLIAALVLSITATAGLTMAYFSDYEAAQGDAELRLGGTTELLEEIVDNNKHIQIENTGETYMLVRVRVIGDENYLTVQDEAGAWTQSGDYWYYNEVLAPGGVTSELFAEVKAKGAAGTLPEDDFDIIVVHESAQAVYDNDESRLVAPTDDWAVLPEND